MVQRFCAVVLSVGLAAVTIGTVWGSSPQVKYAQDFGCSPGLFGCDPDFVMGGACSPQSTRAACKVTKKSGDGNCFAGRKHPDLDTTNIWESSDPHDCRCRVHAGASGPSFGSVACFVEISENGPATPPPYPYFESPPAQVGCCGIIGSTGNYGCTSSQMVYQAKLLGVPPGTDALALCQNGGIGVTINGQVVAPSRCNTVGAYAFGIFNATDPQCN